MPPLVIEQVTKSYGRAGHSVPALRGVSLEVQAGQFLAIMGASGSGKSTLLHLMAGLTRPESGRVVVRGTDLSHMRDKPLTLFRRRHIGLVFQSFNLIPTLTAEQNILLPLMLEGSGQTDAARQKVESLLETLGMTHRRHHRPDALSGGEQQRVAIGRALVCDPAVILADEPTGNLDSTNSRAVCELLRDLTQVHNKTIVMVTHEPSVAAFSSDVAVLRDGKLVERFDSAAFADGRELAVRYQEALR